MRDCGAQMYRKNPGFTLAAVTVLALGIGANAAIFSLVNAFLFRPLVMQSPSTLVGCYSRDTKKSDYRAFSYPDYAELRDASERGDGGSVFSSLLAHNLAMVGLSEGNTGTTRRVFADIISSNYFTTFGVPLSQGRAFTPEEERPGSGVPVAIVSNSYWKKIGADPQIVGKTLQINGRIYTVVGVTAKGFTGTTAMISPELYVPLGMYESAVNDFDGRGRSLASRDNHALLLIGRLRPGITQQTADAALATRAAQLASAYPVDDKDQTFIVRPLSRLEISHRSFERLPDHHPRGAAAFRCSDRAADRVAQRGEHDARARDHAATRSRHPSRARRKPRGHSATTSGGRIITRACGRCGGPGAGVLVDRRAGEVSGASDAAGHRVLRDTGRARTCCDDRILRAQHDFVWPGAGVESRAPQSGR